MKDLSSLDFRNKRIVVFDMDGTLIDSIGIWNLTDQRVILHYGGPLVDLEVIQNDRDCYLNSNINSDIYLEYCGYLKDKYGLFANSSEEMLNYRWKVSNIVLEKEIDYKPGAVDFVLLLKKLGFTLVLASMTTKVQMDIYSNKNEKMKEKISIPDVFDLVICKEDVQRKKPDPEVYNLVQDYYHVPPSSYIVIEDSLHGVLSAKNASLEVITLYDKYSKKDHDRIFELTDYFAYSFFDLIDCIKI